MTRLLLLAFLVVGCGGSATSTPAGARSAVTVEGSRIMQSSPVTLSGDYSVRWSASETDTDTPDVGCYHSATLRPVSGSGSEQLGSADVSGEDSGTTNLFGLSAGSYYVDASSGCDWTITFTPS